MARIGTIQNAGKSYAVYYPKSSGTGTLADAVGVKQGTSTLTVGFYPATKTDVNLFILNSVGYMAKPGATSAVVGTTTKWKLPIVKVSGTPTPPVDPKPPVVVIPIDDQITNRRPDASLTKPRISTFIPFAGALRSNTTYTGRSFTGKIDPRGFSDVDFVDCLFDANGAPWCVRCDDRETSSYERRFRNCEFKNMASAAIYGGGWSAIACYVHNSKGDGFKATECVLIQGCYLTKLGMSTGAHADGVQIRGGNNIKIIGNFFDMPTNVSGTSSNAAMFLQDDGNGTDSTNITFSNNWCIGGNYTVCAYAYENIKVTGNTFYTGTPRYGFGNIFAGVVWSGNVTEKGAAATPKMK